MPLAAPIGSGLGVCNPYSIKIIKERAGVPVIACADDTLGRGCFVAFCIAWPRDDQRADHRVGAGVAKGTRRKFERLEHVAAIVHRVDAVIFSAGPFLDARERRVTRNTVLRFASLLLDVFAPQRCGGCGASGDVLCPRCVTEFAAAPLLVRPAADETPLVYAAGLYRSQLRAAVLLLIAAIVCASGGSLEHDSA